MQQLILECRKCEHQVYVNDWNKQKKLEKIMDTDCPHCGEEADLNWTLYGFGLFEDK